MLAIARDVPALITGKTDGFPWVLPQVAARAPAKLASFPGPIGPERQTGKRGRRRGGPSPHPIPGGLEAGRTGSLAGNHSFSPSLR
jgi:hypothetical protein